MQIFIIFGSPGSGKGSVSELLVEKNDFYHFSTGDFFRKILKENNKKKNWKNEQKTLSNGDLVNDKIVNEIILKQLKKYPKNTKIILDGYPRTINQAEFLNDHFEIEKVLYLNNISEEKIINRLSGRYQCSLNSHIFNKDEIKNNLSCIYDGSLLSQRNDDTPEIIKKRIKIYKTETKLVLDYYEKQKKLVKINADQNLLNVYMDINEYLK